VRTFKATTTVRRLLLGLFNNTTLNSAVPSRNSTTTGIRDLWEFYFTEKANLSKLNILMLIALCFNNLLGVHLVTINDDSLL